jgi:DNA-binding transcriptional LysR family regulator
VNVSGVDLNLLVVFDAVMTERNATRAAAKVGRSQPALSNALGRLRRRLRDPLFVRTGRSMTPTPRALEIAPEVDAALRHARRAFEAPAFVPGEARRTFRVATSDEIEPLLLPALLRALGAAAPGVTVAVRRLAGLFETPEADLRSGAVDFAIGHLPGPPPVDSGLHASRLADDRLVCIARTGHPTVRRRLPLSRFVRERHVATFYPGEGPGVIDRLLSQRGQRRHVVLSVPHFLSVPFVVASSDLIATVPGSIAEMFRKLLPLSVFPCPAPLPAFVVNLVWHARTHEEASHVWFRGLVMDAVREARRGRGARRARR